MIFFLFREMLPEMHDKKPAVKTLNRIYACIFGTCVFPRSISYLYACASFLDFFCFYHQLVCLNMPVLESLWLYKADENMCVCACPCRALAG